MFSPWEIPTQVEMDNAHLTNKERGKVRAWASEQNFRKEPLHPLSDCDKMKSVTNWKGEDLNWDLFGDHLRKR